MLNPYLGMKWDERILNPAGNLAYEIPGTIKYWMGQRNPVTEYKTIGSSILNLKSKTAILLHFSLGEVMVIGTTTKQTCKISSHCFVTVL